MLDNLLKFQVLVEWRQPGRRPQWEAITAVRAHCHKNQAFARHGARPEVESALPGRCW